MFSKFDMVKEYLGGGGKWGNQMKIIPSDGSKN